MLAKDVMIKDPVTVDEAVTVREAIETLSAMGVRHLPVTSDGKLSGLLSDRDIRQLTVPVAWNQYVIAEDCADAALLDEPVTALASGGVISVAEDASVGQVIDLICDHGVGAVMVVDEGEAPVGIVSYVDLLRALRPKD